MYEKIVLVKIVVTTALATTKGATNLVMLEVDMDATVVAATPPCELLSPARYERRPHCK
jgi:hypothetical protein